MSFDKSCRMVDKYFRGRTDVDSVENVIISRVSFPYSYPQWMITMQNFRFKQEKPVSSGITTNVLMKK